MVRQIPLLCVLTTLWTAWPVLGAGTPDPALLAGMGARSIGPAAMSGRVAAVDALVADPTTIYVGTATGGLWRSVDGLTWEPLFDDQPVASIGAVAVFQANPDIVWVGTGEGNPRNSASVGNGVYKTIDGGRTWTHLGLEGTERIHRIVLHPTDPDTAWVAAMGRAWGENPERGIFKTVDGGRTWRKVLYVDERTGASDLVMDPTNPHKLLAAMWDYRRWPWFFRSGGPGSGLYLSHDGGENWKRLTEDEGLPGGELGRIGVAIAPSDPRVVYALVEARENVLLRSGDGGESWEVRSRERAIGNRPFYFWDLRVDPENANRVYSLWTQISVSEDGGQTWEVLVPFRQVHPDHHALWINPRDGRYLIDGNDGGVAISRDRGKTWRYVRNLPVGQFYHVRVDDRLPYRVYGGMQDNGSWVGPSQVWERGGIRNHHWQEVHFGDGFDVIPDPERPSQGYAMSQEGYLVRWDLDTGQRKYIRPAPPEGEELRFNWNAGIGIDPFDPDTIYYGSQYVHRSRDRGETWEIISPDLTTDNPEWQRQADSGGLTPDVTGAENFTSILVIAPSAVEQGVIWVATDDGRIHVTRDGGETWTSVEGNVRGVPANTWVPHIEPSPHDGGTAFVVFDDHRRSNWTPYVYRTTDFGRSWRSLATEGVRGYALSIVQDPVDPDLLFLGTEFGLWVSVDGGAGWLQWTHGVPTVSVMDLALQERQHDLVLGTHGRSIYILDDIRPLREIDAGVLDEPLHLFEIPPAQQHEVAQAASSRFPGQGEFEGQNRPYGALITYTLSLPDLPRREDGSSASEVEEEQPKVEIRISAAGGETIRTLEGPAYQGVNRVAWDLRRDAFKEPPRDPAYRWSEPQGPEVPPGVYGVAVAFREHEVRGEVEVLADPRLEVPKQGRRANYEALLHAGRLQEVATEAVRRIAEARSDIDAILEKLNQEEGLGEASPGLREEAGELRKRLDGLERRLWRSPELTKGIPAETDVLSKLEWAQRNLGSSWDPPTPAQQAYLAGAEELLSEVLADFNRFFAEEVGAFRSEVRTREIELLPEWEPLTVESEE